MSESFESAQLLVDGAKEDIEKFNVAEGAFINDPGIATVVSEMERKTGDKLIKLRVLKQPPKVMRLLAYHVVGDLRNALDQATSGAVETVLGGKAKDTFFPFATHPNDLKYKLRKIPAGLHPFFERQQPYPRGNGYEGGDDALRMLGAIANPNKHEIALRVGVNANAMHIIESVGNNVSIPWPGMNRATNEMILFRIHPGGSVNYNLNVPLFVAFSQSKGADDAPALQMLQRWWAKVSEIIKSLESESLSLAGGKERSC